MLCCQLLCYVIIIHISLSHSPSRCFSPQLISAQWIKSTSGSHLELFRGSESGTHDHMNDWLTLLNCTSIHMMMIRRWTTLTLQIRATSSSTLLLSKLNQFLIGLWQQLSRLTSQLSRCQLSLITPTIRSIAHSLKWWVEIELIIGLSAVSILLLTPSTDYRRAVFNINNGKSN